MKKIVFENGEMAAMYPDGLNVEGASAWECISALQNVPGFRKTDGKFYTVTLPDFQSKDAFKEPTNRTEIRVQQIIGGAGGKGGFALMIVVGVILIATGMWATAGLYTAGGTMIVSQATLYSVGAMLVLQGVVGLLMPSPEVTKQGNEEKSNYLPANKNTVRIGTRIPIVYGRNKLFGHFLSFNIGAVNALRPAAPAPAEQLPSGGSTEVDTSGQPMYQDENGVLQPIPITNGDMWGGA